MEVIRVFVDLMQGPAGSRSYIYRPRKVSKIRSEHVVSSKVVFLLPGLFLCLSTGCLLIFRAAASLVRRRVRRVTKMR